MDVWRIVCWIRWRYSANVYSNSRILMYTRVYSCIFVYIRVYSCIYSRTRDRCARGSFVRFSFLVGKKERSHFDSKITLYSIDICSDTMLVECRCRTEIVSERKISRTRRDETRRDETRRDTDRNPRFMDFVSPTPLPSNVPAGTSLTSIARDSLSFPLALPVARPPAMLYRGRNARDDACDDPRNIQGGKNDSMPFASNWSYISIAIARYHLRRSCFSISFLNSVTRAIPTNPT